jgi:sulfur carrier protein ThiS
MTDEFNTQAEDEPIVAPAIAEELTEEVDPAASVEEDDEEEDFFSDEEEFAIPDPTTVVTIQTSSGGKFYVPVGEGGMSVKDLMTAAHLTVGVVEYWLNGSAVNADTVIPGGQTLSVVGVVKGGVA